VLNINARCIPGKSDLIESDFQSASQNCIGLEVQSYFNLANVSENCVSTKGDLSFVRPLILAL
jgi:hypothetical protein